MRQINDFLLVISLVGVIALATYSGTLQKKIATFPDSVKIAEKVSYNAGCMTAIRAAHQIPDGDPLNDLYLDWCTKNAANWSTMMVIQVK